MTKTWGRISMVILVVPVLALAVIGGTLYAQHRTADQDRRKALAGAEADARRYAAELLPAFAAGPQTARSLTALGHRTGIDYVSAAIDGASVVVTWERVVTYADGWVTSTDSYCMRDRISREDGALSEQLSSIPCTAMLPSADPDTELRLA